MAALPLWDWCCFRIHRKLSLLAVPKETASKVKLVLLFQPDSNQIVGRLMQIRDYIKQASSMMEQLLRSQDAVGITKTM